MHRSTFGVIGQSDGSLVSRLRKSPGNVFLYGSEAEYYFFDFFPCHFQLPLCRTGSIDTFLCFAVSSDGIVRLKVDTLRLISRVRAISLATISTSSGFREPWRVVGEIAQHFRTCSSGLRETLHCNDLFRLLDAGEDIRSSGTCRTS